MRHVRLFLSFILLTLGWMSTFEVLFVEAKPTTTMNNKNFSNDIRVPHSVIRLFKRQDPIKSRDPIRLCQRRILEGLKYVCSRLLGSNSNNGIIISNQEIPIYSNVVDACCKNSCNERQLIHYCKEFRTRSTFEPLQLVQQEADSNSVPITPPGPPVSLVGWNERRCGDVPTSTEIEVGLGENDGSIVFDY